MASNLAHNSVLVVGGCSFLGHHIVKYLLQVQAKVSVLDINHNHNHVEIQQGNAGVQYYTGDIFLPEDVKRVYALCQPLVVIHTGAPSTASWDTSVCIGLNIFGTRRLLEYALVCKSIRAFVFTSSAAIVHDDFSNLDLVNESAPVLRSADQPSYFNHTKAVGEEIVREYSSTQSYFKTVCLRPSDMFGEGDDNILPKILADARAGRNNFSSGSGGKNRVDFTYVGNVAAAHVLASEILLTEALYPRGSSKIAGEAFFITNDEPWTVRDFTHAVMLAADYPVPDHDVCSTPRTVGALFARAVAWLRWTSSFGNSRRTISPSEASYDDLTRTYHIGKAKSMLGYEPTVTVEEGVKRGVDWVLSEDRESSQQVFELEQGFADE